MSIKLTPLNEVQTKALETLLVDAGQAQLNWLSGYFHGLSSGFSVNGTVLSQSSIQTGERVAPLSVTILYGSHTGRCEGLAKQLQTRLEEKSITAKSIAMNDYNPRQFSNEDTVLIIVSTHGEGEPPEMAEDFHGFMLGKRAPKLPHLNYSVLALGDKSYKLFCQTGVDFDQALAKAGATPISPLLMCDVDYEEEAKAWADTVVDKLVAKQAAAQANALTPVAAPNTTAITNAQTEVVVYDKKNPFKATVIDKAKITGDGSDKEVYHLELDLSGSGIHYEPGDALGIVASNPPSLVEQIISQLAANAETTVTLKAGAFSLVDALTKELEITLLTRDVIQQYAQQIESSELRTIVADDSLLDDYLWGHDVLDLLVEFPAPLSAQAVVDLLRPLPPRLYSIASSQQAVGEEVHITVAAVRYANKDRKREGAASTLLADRINIDDEVSVFIQKTPGFRLPDNPQSNIIMVGAGTGIAPFRAFMQQAEAEKRPGKSWLFFGERRFYSDFLYQIEWQKYLKKGVLDKIDLAFSRDQTEKIYVQHRLLVQQAEVFKWLENGASFYLCGDMKYMAKDVQKLCWKLFKNKGI